MSDIKRLDQCEGPLYTWYTRKRSLPLFPSEVLLPTWGLILYTRNIVQQSGNQHHYPADHGDIQDTWKAHTHIHTLLHLMSYELSAEWINASAHIHILCVISAHENIINFTNLTCPMCPQWLLLYLQSCAGQQLVAAAVETVGCPGGSGGPPTHHCYSRIFGQCRTGAWTPWGQTRWNTAVTSVH